MTRRIPDFDAVCAAVQLYIEGANKGDVDMLKKAFHPTATLHGFIQGQFMNGSIEAYYDVVRTAPAQSGEPHKARIASVEIHGPMALVKLIEDSYLGMDFVNFFQLAKVAGQWRIMSKAFQHDA